MNIFYKYAKKYKGLRNKLQHHNINTIILGMEAFGESQDGKTGAAVKYGFYYRENMEL